MKQLLVLSGKGGTGKTTMATALVELSGTRAFADCDVDAPNLHLSTKVTAPAVSADFEGMPRALVDSASCVGCGACERSCRFGAIKVDPDECIAHVNRISCEGCRVCVYVCPQDAISMTPEVVGSTMLHACADEVFSTAYLRAGAGNSGKLVAAVKRNLTESAENLDEHAAALSPFAVIDGSPGIGCPVIASLAKVDMVLIVAEPSASGISDVERLLEVVERLRVKVALCVNKADIDPNSTQRLRELCETIGIPFAGAVPYDHAMAKSVSEGRSTWEGPAYEAVRGVYECVMELLAPDCPLPRSASSAAVDSSAAAACPAVDSSAASADQAQGE